MINKQEALDVLECFRRNTAHILGDNDEKVETIETCVMLVQEVEEAEKWIPVSENVPEVEEGYEYFDGDMDAWLIAYESKNVLITDGEGIEVGNYCRDRRVDDETFIPGGGWICENDAEMSSKVIAWMPLPEPYKEARDE